MAVTITLMDRSACTVEGFVESAKSVATVIRPCSFRVRSPAEAEVLLPAAEPRREPSMRGHCRRVDRPDREDPAQPGDPPGSGRRKSAHPRGDRPPPTENH